MDRKDSGFPTVQEEEAELATSVSLRVRYGETDQMGYAYYGNYLMWFEVARSEYCRARGFSYAELEREEETFLPVVEAFCRYRKPLRYDQAFQVVARVLEFGGRSLEFGYAVYDAAGEILHAEGRTRHIFTNNEGKPVRLSETYARHFRLSKREEDHAED